ncbi:MAG: endonuclease/exonuclease/phosphatase family protein, partial [Muribaculaceae bacterium]|nr:endonuclease/exonuclease/phosphatase family protein [Muribaculaceae bacterium]
MFHRQLYNSIFSLLLLTVTLCSCTSTSDRSDTEAVFNVATYNIRQANASDSMRGDGWGQRSPVVASLIRFHEFNIFGTQEGFKHQLEDLKSQLPGYDYIGVARDDGKEQGEHSAIFYDTAMFDLIDHGDFWLSETPDRPGLGWDAACVRICTWGKFRHRPSGKVFQFFNLHQDHIGV